MTGVARPGVREGEDTGDPGSNRPDSDTPKASRLRPSHPMPGHYTSSVGTATPIEPTLPPG